LTRPCSIRWIGRYLAGRGWVVIDVFRPPTTDPTDHANAALQRSCT
jgi:hypothetical protein